MVKKNTIKNPAAFAEFFLIKILEVQSYPKLQLQDK